ncbi:MAG: hypothetical protein RLZZ455_112 [Candidatus Parcubacteria bacterium]|jgi:hypothetical protein
MFKSTGAKTPEEYIRSIDEPRRSEMRKMHEFIISVVPDLKSFMISGMIGYGSYHYVYASGREGDWSVIGLASQKNYISVYVCAVTEGVYIAEKYKKDLPKASIGRSCVRFKKIEDVDFGILKKMLLEAAATLPKT